MQEYMLHVYTHTHIIYMKQLVGKEAMNLKESKEGSMGRFGERKGKGK